MYQQFPIPNLFPISKLQNQIQGYPIYYNQIPYTPNVGSNLPLNLIPIYQAKTNIEPPKSPMINPVYHTNAMSNVESPQSYSNLNPIYQTNAMSNIDTPSSSMINPIYHTNAISNIDPPQSSSMINPVYHTNAMSNIETPQLYSNLNPIYQSHPPPNIYPYSYTQVPMFSPYVYSVPPSNIEYNEETPDEYQEEPPNEYQEDDYQDVNPTEYQEEDYYKQPELDEKMYEYKYLNPEEYLSTYNDIPDEQLTNDQRLQKQMNLYLIKNKHLIEEHYHKQMNKLKKMKELESEEALELKELEKIRLQKEEERKQIEQERLRKEEEQRLLEEQQRYEEIQNQEIKQSIQDANEKYPNIEEIPLDNINEQHEEQPQEQYEEQTQEQYEEQPSQQYEEQPEQQYEEQPEQQREQQSEQQSEQQPEQQPSEQSQEQPFEQPFEQPSKQSQEQPFEQPEEKNIQQEYLLKEQQLKHERELKEKEIELEKIKKFNEDRITKLEQIEKDRLYKQEQLELKLKKLEEQKEQPIEKKIEQPIAEVKEEPKEEIKEDKKDEIKESLLSDIYRETELDGIQLNSNMSTAELDYYVFNYLLSLPDEMLKSLNKHDNCNKLMKTIANKIPKSKEISLYMSKFYIRIYQVYVLIDNLFDPKIEYKSDRSLLYFNKPDNIPELKSLFFDIYDPIKKEYNKMSPNMENMYTKMLHQFTQSFTNYEYDLSLVKEYADIDIKKIDYIPRTSDNIVDIYANALKALHLIIKEYQNDLNSLILKMFKKEDKTYIVNPQLTYKTLEEEIIPTVFKHVGYISDRINECFVNIENIFEVIVEQQTLITTFYRIQYIEKKIFELY